MGELVLSLRESSGQITKNYNRDSYHHPEAADKEYAYEGKGSGLLRGQSRGTKRYDPYTRKYVEWTIGENHETNPNSYPTITMSEAHQLSMKIQPKNWNGYGPKVSFLGLL